MPTRYLPTPSAHPTPAYGAARTLVSEAPAESAKTRDRLDSERFRQILSRRKERLGPAMPLAPNPTVVGVGDIGKEEAVEVEAALGSSSDPAGGG